VGGSLTRHDLGVQQDGSDTTTTMKHFVLAGERIAHRTAQWQSCFGQGFGVWTDWNDMCMQCTNAWQLGGLWCNVWQQGLESVV
jgi:hypothetical protein